MAVAGSELAPGHNALISKNTHWAGYFQYRAKCSCGWRSGDNRIRAHSEAELLSHWSAVLAKTKRSNGDG